MSPEKQPPYELEIPTDADVVTYSQFLAKKIRESGFKPQGIIGIERGGVVPAGLLSIWFKVPPTSLKVVKEGELRRVVHDPNINWELISGKRIILAEDILETGRSAQAGLDFLREHGADVRLACFFTRPQTEIEPDYVLVRNVTIPITFPWEINQRPA